MSDSVATLRQSSTTLPDDNTQVRGTDREQALSLNNWIVLIASAVSMPFAILALTQGSKLPILLAGFALGAVLVAMRFVKRSRYSAVLAMQVATLVGIGGALSFFSTELVNFGLALTLLAPIHASILGNRKDTWLAWGLAITSIGAAAIASQLPGLSIPPQGTSGIWSPVIAYSVAALMVAKSAISINRTDRRQADAETDAFNHLIEHVRDAVMRFGADGELIFISASSQKLFGCQKFELPGAGLAERTHVLDRPLFLKSLSDARTTGHEHLIEVRMRRDAMTPGKAVPDYVWIEINLSPVPASLATTEGFEVVAIMRDISYRKQDERRMTEARNAAQSVSLAKSQFLATMGHELRTPLNAIVGFSDLMLNNIGGELPENHKEHARIISQSGQHLLGVVNMLLDMSKIEAGRFELQTDKFAPESLVAPCIQMVTRTTREKRVEVELDIDNYIPEIVGDERACRQILINLLSNAIKFSEPGGKVTWSMKRQGHYLNISVADQGIGMTPEVVSRLGEPFFQAQNGSDRAYEGTGLGISIVKGLVELHHGTINFASALGQGTKITVLLPINGPEVHKDDKQPITELHPTSSETQGEKWQEPRKIAQ